MEIIISFLLLVLNIPMLTAISKGIQLHTDSTCPEDIRDIKHNKRMLQGITTIDIIMGIVLLILSL